MQFVVLTMLTLHVLTLQQFVAVHRFQPGRFQEFAAAVRSLGVTEVSELGEVTDGSCWLPA